MSDWDEDWGASSAPASAPAAPAKKEALSDWKPSANTSNNAGGDSDWSTGFATSSAPSSGNTGGGWESSGGDAWGSSSGGGRGGSSRGAGSGCYNCGGSGHMSRDCPEPRKERGGGSRSGGCYNCGGSGHMSRDCPEPKKERGPGGGACYNCGGSGHMSRDCPEPKKERSGPGSCYNCGQSGHMSRDCPAPRKERGRSGSFSKGGSSSGAGGWDTGASFGTSSNNANQSNGGTDFDWAGGSSSSNTARPQSGGSGNDLDWGSGGGSSHAPKPQSSFGGNENGGWDSGASSSFGGGRSSGMGGGSGRGCRNCGEEGHFARECPKPRSGGPGGAGGSGCRNCGQQGHFARECPNPRSASGFSNSSGGAPTGGLVGVVPSEGPPREHFQPEHELENEELFSAELTIPTGINFDKYEKIEVHVSGNDADSIKPMQSFAEANLRDVLKSNVLRAGFNKPTPVQKYTIPAALAQRDVIACAQTGSGKTAAYLLPILHRLLSEESTLLHHASPMSPVLEPSCIIFAPTRELARQITEQCRKFACGTIIQAQMVYGGINRSYQRDRGSRIGCHVLVGTIGRIHDFIRSGDLKLDYVRFLVVDEADRMLDEGFGPEVRQIIGNYGMPGKDQRWTMMFSATMKGDVQRLAADMLRQDYLFLAVGLVGGACDDVVQEILAVPKSDKVLKLTELLDADNIKEASTASNASKVLIFCEEKKKADFLCGLLNTRGYMATSIHGDRLQSQREQALNDFRAGRRPILVATSVCARGLDIVGVQHVINYDLPKEIDDYVHRIGRTGRCGNTGRATSFFDAERDFGLSSFLVQKLKEQNVPVPDFLGGSVAGYGGYGGSQSYIARDVRSDVHRVVTDDWGSEGAAVAPTAAMASMAISNNDAAPEDDTWG